MVSPSVGEVHERLEQPWKMGTRSAEEPSVTKVTPCNVVVDHKVSLGNRSVSVKFQKVTPWADINRGHANSNANTLSNND
jgi:hypothetical protein